MRLRSRFLPFAAATALALAACAGDDVQDPGVEDPETEVETDTDGDDPAAEDDAADNDALEDGTDGDATDGDDATDDDSAGTDTAGGEVELAVASSDLGEHLVDGEGRTVYLSTLDDDGTSNCETDCSQIWQPVTGEATVSGDLDESLLGTADREDGETQVTYDGAPLYHFVSDAAEGDARGHGVNGTWWLVDPEGGPIEEGGAQSEPGGAGTDDAEEEVDAEEDDGDDA